MSRRSFDKAFKSAALKLIIEESFSVKEMSAQFNVHVSSLYRQVQEVEKNGDSAFPVKRSAFFDTHYEIKKLEQENRYLREEFELLKNFQVFLKPSKKSDFNS